MGESIDTLIEEIRLGRMIVLMDDEGRENEGDVVMAAQKVTPAHITFMATYARGLICVPLEGTRLDTLSIPQHPIRHGSAFETAFSFSVEARYGVTTGISAADRSRTIQTLIAPETTEDDISMPGHVFPLRGSAGGVLKRPGHTEAALDLARLAGFQPAGVICEIIKDNGEMARKDDLEVFCRQHDLKLGTIADLIDYRKERGL